MLKTDLATSNSYEGWARYGSLPFYLPARLVIDSQEVLLYRNHSKVFSASVKDVTWAQNAYVLLMRHGHNRLAFKPKFSWTGRFFVLLTAIGFPIMVQGEKVQLALPILANIVQLLKSGGAIEESKLRRLGNIVKMIVLSPLLIASIALIMISLFCFLVFFPIMVWLSPQPLSVRLLAIGFAAGGWGFVRTTIRWFDQSFRYDLALKPAHKGRYTIVERILLIVGAVLIVLGILGPRR